MKKDLVVTIIPNWNLKKDLGECLDSVLASTHPNNLIVVVDNGSQDGSVNFVQENYPKVQIIALPENLGYAGAVNYGIEWALKQSANFVFILNNDTIVSPQAISQVVEVMIKNQYIGIASPKILHYHKPNRIYSLGTKSYKVSPLPISIGKNHYDSSKYSKIQKFDYVTGTAMMISGSCIEKTGLFNTNYFMYYEDSEYCRRAQENGFSIVCVGYSTIFHKGGVSASKNMEKIVNIRARNRFVYYRKYPHGPSKRLTNLVIWLIALWKTCGYFLRGKIHIIKPYLSGLWQGYKEPI